MNNYIEVYECGNVVKVKLSNAVGYITGVCIRGRSITYEVSFSVDLKHKSMWFYDYELEFVDRQTFNIGVV